MLVRGRYNMKKDIIQHHCILWMVILLIILIISGCSSDSVVKPETVPFRIISFTGEMIPIADSNEFQYRQTILWQGPFVSGVEYAVRMETTDDELPEGYFTDPDGWVYYSPAGEPCTEADAPGRTIWHGNRNFTIEFSSQDGVLKHILSAFHVKYRYEGKIGDPISKSFTVGEVGTVIQLPWGPVDYDHDYSSSIAVTGEGLKIGFSESIDNIFVQGLYAESFNYRLNIVHEFSGEVISYGEWFNTMESYDIREILLNRFTEPPLLSNNPDELTQIEAYMVTNYHGIDISPASRKFRVASGFEPQAMIYRRNCYLLGENHFTTFKVASINLEIPKRQSPEGTIYGLPFFINRNGTHTALYSSDLKIHFNLGWKGKYLNNNPAQALLNRVSDAGTGVNYYSEIVSVDLRLNNAPYPHDFYENHPEYLTGFLHTDPDGTIWLRAPVNEFVPTHPPVSADRLLTGENILHYRVMDNQMVLSNTVPLTFILQERIPASGKSGILIVDNEYFSQLDPEINDFYDYVVSDYSGPTLTLDRRWLKDNVWDSHMHYGRNVIVPTDLEPYRLIIWHCDHPLEVSNISSNFQDDFDTINLYMRGGGNILLSAGQNLRNMNDLAKAQGFYNFIFEKYFGIPYHAHSAIRSFSTNWSQNPFFIGADKSPETAMNLPDLDLNFYFYHLPNLFGGFGPVAYFDLSLITDPAVEPIYQMRTNEDGIEFEGKPVALRRVTENNRTYMFGFPLSFMDADQVKDMINQIITDVYTY